MFIPVLYAGALLIVIGTLIYAVGEHWDVLDAFYFAVATLTTSSIADPNLVLDSVAGAGADVREVRHPPAHFPLPLGRSGLRRQVQHGRARASLPVLSG